MKLMKRFKCCLSSKNSMLSQSIYFHNDINANNFLRGEIETVCDEIRKVFPQTIEIVLWGSYSFNDGLVKIDNKRIVPLSDYDIFVILSPLGIINFKGKLKQIRGALNGLLGRAHISIGFSILHHLGFQTCFEGTVLYSRLGDKALRPWVCNVSQSYKRQMLNLKLAYNDLLGSNPLVGNNFPVKLYKMVPYINGAFFNAPSKYEFKNNIEYFKKKSASIFSSAEIKLIIQSYQFRGKKTYFSNSDWFVAREITNKLFRGVAKKGGSKNKMFLNWQLLNYSMEQWIQKRGFKGGYFGVVYFLNYLVNSINDGRGFDLDLLKKASLITRSVQIGKSELDEFKRLQTYYYDNFPGSLLVIKC